jgi:hypothetical protein
MPSDRIENKTTMTTSNTDTVVHQAYQTADGVQCATVQLTKADDTREKQIMFAPPWTIPVIFVPGVMGSNLKVKGGQDGESVWQPPNSTLGGLPLVFEFLFKGPKARQERFNPANAEVDWNGPIDPGPIKLNEPEGTVATLRKRGWGSVYADSYHGLLQQLHLQLNDMALPRAVAKVAPLPDFWAKLEQDPQQWGSTSGQAKPANREQLRQLCRYRFDIWACGYNWLQSNLESGKDLHAYIQKVLNIYHPDGCSKPFAKKVIIVTHSMGGLVLRGLLQIPGATNNILGVVHGVQPAAGAPAVYKRMRAGFEGIEQVIFGRDAAEAVPVVANSPALLEMLPFANYNLGQPWLKVGPSADKPAMQWPSKADGKPANPYKDIYASEAWYGLIPERNNGLIDPAGINKKIVKPGQSVREGVFEKRLLRVEEFHSAITQPDKGYHPHTWAHGAIGLADKRLTWGEVHWRGDVIQGLDLSNAALLKDDGNDRIELSGGIKLQIAKPAQSGDGTVPGWSLAAPAQAMGVQDLALHGDGSVPGHAGLNQRRVDNPEAKARQPGYDHQNSYKDERALWATFHAIVQISQKADWA